MRGKPFDDVVVELLREDLNLAVEMLNGILEDSDQGELLTALRRMAKAFSGVPKVAEQAHLNPTQLYRTLLPAGSRLGKAARDGGVPNKRAPRDRCMCPIPRFRRIP